MFSPSVFLQKLWPRANTVDRQFKDLNNIINTHKRQHNGLPSTEVDSSQTDLHFQFVSICMKCYF